jgi:hypothetical protein
MKQSIGLRIPGSSAALGMIVCVFLVCLLTREAKAQRVWYADGDIELWRDGKRQPAGPKDGDRIYDKSRLVLKGAVLVVEYECSPKEDDNGTPCGCRTFLTGHQEYTWIRGRSPNDLPESSDNDIFAGDPKSRTVAARVIWLNDSKADIDFLDCPLDMPRGLCNLKRGSAAGSCTVELVSPLDNAELVPRRLPNGQVSNVWRFSWSACPGATQYHLYVRGPTARNPVVNRDDLTSTSYTYERTNYSMTTLQGWRWWVRAKVDGRWGPWSGRSFDVSATK